MHVSAHTYHLIKNGESAEPSHLFDSREPLRVIVNITEQFSSVFFARLQPRDVTAYFYDNHKGIPRIFIIVVKTVTIKLIID